MCMDVAMVGGLCEPLVKKNNKTGYNFRLTSRVDEWRAVTSAALRRRKKITKMAKIRLRTQVVTYAACLNDCLSWTHHNACMQSKLII